MEARDATPEQIAISAPRHPFGACEGAPRPVALMLRIDMQHNPGNLAPVGAFNVGVKKAPATHDVVDPKAGAHVTLSHKIVV